MDEGETKICQNCKREIPSVNFTIHTVHCARNIRVCPVCKEPVPQAELQDHHEKLHKLLPCKACGESVCGTDLEDHIRDSCGHTIKSCRYCELELPRRSLPAHEGYCGARTEQCADCGEWVMAKYRQLHLDSNHGFLRLDDDPLPQPKKEPPKSTNIPKNINAVKPINTQASTSFVKNTNLEQNRPRTEIRYLNGSGDAGGPSASGSGSQDAASAARAPLYNALNGDVPRAPLKRTNDQPQINTAVAATNKINKDIPISRGAVKKRPAPKPPAREPPTADPKRDLAYNSALQRHREEEKRRQEQNAYNLSVGLPPVLTPAAKLDKLRKMDALQNREVEPPDYRERLQGRVWMERQIPTGQTLGSESLQDSNYSQTRQNLAADRRRINHDQNDTRNYISDNRNNTSNTRNNTSDTRNNTSDTRNNTSDTRNNLSDTRNRPRNNEPRVPIAVDTNDFRNLTPMTPQEFVERFNELQLRRETERDGERRTERAEAKGDRFSEIKSSLRELRRGLNEVTAPYNATNSNSAVNHNSERPARRVSPAPAPAPAPTPRASLDEPLPCEFCAQLVPAHDLVQHQTGCRPDLAQLRPRSASPRGAPAPRPRSRPAAPARPAPPPDPVIPCEFCTESLPVYLIIDHQEQCQRNQQMLYAD